MGRHRGARALHRARQGWRQGFLCVRGKRQRTWDHRGHLPVDGWHREVHWNSGKQHFPCHPDWQDPSLLDCLGGRVGTAVTGEISFEDRENAMSFLVFGPAVILVGCLSTAGSAETPTE